MSRRYLAYINGSLVSGVLNTKQEAIDWAATQLGANVKFVTAHICEVVAEVSREIPPIKVKDIPLSVADICEQGREAGVRLEAAE